MERADAALALMRQAAQEAAARYKAARLEVARLKAERLSHEAALDEAAAGFETLAAELSDAFPTPAEEPAIELPADVVVRCVECGCDLHETEVYPPSPESCIDCGRERERLLAQAADDEAERERAIAQETALADASVAEELAHWAGEDVTAAANGPSPGPLTAAALKAAQPATNGRKRKGKR